MPMHPIVLLIWSVVRSGPAAAQVLNTRAVLFSFVLSMGICSSGRMNRKGYPRRCAYGWRAIARSSRRRSLGAVNRIYSAAPFFSPAPLSAAHGSTRTYWSPTPFVSRSGRIHLLLHFRLLISFSLIFGPPRLFSFSRVLLKYLKAQRLKVRHVPFFARIFLLVEIFLFFNLIKNFVSIDISFHQGISVCGKGTNHFRHYFKFLQRMDFWQINVKKLKFVKFWYLPEIHLIIY